MTHDYKRPYKPRAYDFTYEVLHDMRVKRGLSLEEIAARFGGCHHTTIWHALRRLGVHVSPPLIQPSEPRDFTYEALYDLRVNRGRSLKQIADYFGCSITTIWRALRQLGVPTDRPLIKPIEPSAPPSERSRSTLPLTPRL